jgi:hypothetical protein
MAKKKKKDHRHDNPGRPPASEGGSAPVGGDDAAIVISLRVSPVLRDRVELAAKKAGASTSQWWRDAALAALS